MLSHRAYVSLLTLRCAEVSTPWGVTLPEEELQSPEQCSGNAHASDQRVIVCLLKHSPCVVWMLPPTVLWEWQAEDKGRFPERASCEPDFRHQAARPGVDNEQAEAQSGSLPALGHTP